MTKYFCLRGPILHADISYSLYEAEVDQEEVYRNTIRKGDQYSSGLFLVVVAKQIWMKVNIIVIQQQSNAAMSQKRTFQGLSVY